MKLGYGVCGREKRNGTTNVRPFKRDLKRIV